MRRFLIATACAAGTPALAQPAAEPIDSTAIAFIQAETIERGQVMDHATWMTDVHGARLTGSETLNRAQEWAVERFRSWDVDADLEPWGTFGLGWMADDMAMSARVAGPDVAAQSFPLTAAPKAWSPSLGDASGELVILDLADETLDVASMDLSGKVVLLGDISEVARGLEPIAQRHDDHDLLELANAGLAGTRGAQRRYSAATIARFRARQARTDAVLNGGPLAILTPSGTGGSGAVRAMQANVSSDQSSGAGGRAAPWTPGVETVAQFALLDEHANRLIRLVEAGQTVTIDIDFAATFTPEAVVEDNVMAEIRGTDLADEVVIIGAHFDSWHSGSGATDNAAGSAVVMEAARVLKAYYDERGEGPRRTIRFALWTGEEQGLFGSREYVSQHYAPTAGYGEPPSDILPDHAKISAYYNMDNGSGRFRGIYLQSNEAVRPIFGAWLRAFGDDEAQTLSIRNTGGT
ncbi:MAG: M28 family peptidase, partial [Bacteroidota bacterium]